MLEINLLPVREVRKRAEVRQIVVQLGLVLVLAVCAVGAVHLQLRDDMNRVASRIHQMERDIARFKPQLDQVEAFKKKKNELQKNLEKVTGRKVRLNFATDEGLIGGLVTRVGSTVYDGSVRTKLENLREQLVNG